MFKYGTDSLNRVVNQLSQRTPPSWKLRLLNGRVQRLKGTGLLEIKSPDGASSKLTVEWLNSLDPKDVSNLISRFRRSAGNGLLIAAPFLSPRTREKLVEANASYSDLTGNTRISFSKPGLFIETMGATKNPGREKRPLRSLKGPATAKVIRAVCDFRPPYGVRELATRINASPASISRVFNLLDKEAIVRKNSRGMILEVDWQALIRAWVETYNVFTSNRALSFLEPRGLSALLEKLKGSKQRYSITGSFAASRRAAVAPPRLLLVYVDSPEEGAQNLSVQPTEAGQNVILLEPFDPVVFERTWQDDGLTFANPSQVAPDLLTSPGRGPAEAEKLMEWMKENEDTWRS
jgi:hypothetical protein